MVQVSASAADGNIIIYTSIYDTDRSCRLCGLTCVKIERVETSVLRKKQGSARSMPCYHWT